MLKIPNLTKKEQQVLDEFKKEIFQKLKGKVLELKLFGSKARGASKRYSDIDMILVLEKEIKKDRAMISDLTCKLFVKYGVDLSVKVFSKKEFQYLNDLQTPFMLNIQREAMAI